jgi:hypothetical protein
MTTPQAGSVVHVFEWVGETMAGRTEQRPNVIERVCKLARTHGGAGARS